MATAGPPTSLAEKLSTSSSESVPSSSKVDVQSALIDDFIERQEQRVVKYLRRLKHLVLELHVIINLCKGRRRSANIAQFSLNTAAATVGPGLIVGGIAIPPLAIAGFVTTLVASIGATLTRFGVFIANRRLRSGYVQAWKDKYETARLDFLEEFAEYVRFAQRVVEIRAFVHDRIQEGRAPVFRKKSHENRLTEAEMMTGVMSTVTVGVKTACTTFQVIANGPGFTSKALLSMPHGVNAVTGSTACAVGSLVSTVSIATASVTAVGAFVDAAAAVSVGIDMYNGNKSQLATQLEACQAALIQQINDFSACFLEVGKSLHPTLNANFQEFVSGYNVLDHLNISRSGSTIALGDTRDYDATYECEKLNGPKASVISVRSMETSLT